MFDGVDDVLRTLLLDPQTSGGLLVGVPAAHAEAWQRACATKGVRPVQIDQAMAGSGRIVDYPPGFGRRGPIRTMSERADKAI